MRSKFATAPGTEGAPAIPIRTDSIKKSPKGRTRSNPPTVMERFIMYAVSFDRFVSFCSFRRRNRDLSDRGHRLFHLRLALSKAPPAGRRHPQFDPDDLDPRAGHPATFSEFLLRMTQKLRHNLNSLKVEKSTESTCYNGNDSKAR